MEPWRPLNIWISKLYNLAIVYRIFAHIIDRNFKFIKKGELKKNSAFHRKTELLEETNRKIYDMKKVKTWEKSRVSYGQKLTARSY